jgi:hypothetical protein
MNQRLQHVTGVTIAALFLAMGSLVLAQEQKPFSPALEQLRETVSERLQTVADKLGLTLRQEARKRRITSNVKPFIGTLRVTNPVR